MMISALSASNVLEVWEQAKHELPARRSLRLLNQLSPTLVEDKVEERTAGERNRQLLFLRKYLFGDAIQASTECPNCAARVELGFSISALCRHEDAPDQKEQLLVAEDYNVRWRLPTSLELAEFSDELIPERIRERLLARCLLDVRSGDQQLDPLDCPPAIIDAVSAAMADADPYGNMQLELNCPECSESWHATFDAGMFLWQEIDSWAYRLLSEVHCLATSYGWSEQEILGMSGQRRGLYLEMVQ